MLFAIRPLSRAELQSDRRHQENPTKLTKVLTTYNHLFSLYNQDKADTVCSPDAGINCYSGSQTR